MQDARTAAILKLAQIINPQIQPQREFHIDLEQLRQLPDGTLGREVARFLDENGFEPLDSGDWIQRTHDVWHVLTGLSSDEGDELTLQAFVRAQVFRPSAAILVLLGLLARKCSPKAIVAALKRGKRTKSSIGWDIESDWATPLSEVRQKLGIVPFRRPTEVS
ncbi:MAG: Coq4 family protein [Cyanobacteriota bacterium]|nr:Coq4 family protein [Cyanobacteriota bacterium]